MRKYLTALGIVFLLCGTVEAKDVNKEVCSTYLSMYCTRCHNTERICTGLDQYDKAKWQKVITVMADYDDMNRDVRDTINGCLDGMKPGDTLVCKKK